MADGTLDDALFALIDNWPGAPMEAFPVPTGGFTGATHHNVATEVYKLGTKIQVYNTGASGLQGFSTFIYLKFEGTSAPTSAAKQVCTPDANTSLTTVTNDPDSALAIPSLPSAVSISLMTDAYYGWFWCGGVCPVQYVSGLGGNYATVGDVALGSTMIASNLSVDAIGWAIAAAAATDLIAAYTLSTDS